MFGTNMGDMYKIWLIFDLRLALIGLSALLFVVALIIHTLLLSTDRYNWLESGVKVGTAPAAQMAQPVQGQTQ